MYLRILAVTILFFVGNTGEKTDPNFSISFTRDELNLTKCIENQVLHFGHFFGYTFVDNEIAQLIGRVSANKVSGKTFTHHQFRTSVLNCRIELNRQKPNKLKPGDKNLWKRLSILITNALRMCSNDETAESSSSKLPVFEGESPEIAAVLDYILVNWPMNLRYMVQNKNSRALVRKFANEAMAILKRAVDSVPSIDDFRRMIREFWIRRAERYFDGRDNQNPYIAHLYTPENPTPHTYQNDTESNFSNRSCQSFSDRNPIKPLSSVYKILDIHAVDRPGNGEFDPFDQYLTRRSMTSAEFYFETYIDQFYRIIFYDLESRMLNDNEELPTEIQEIVYNDFKYRYYLIVRRINELEVENEIQNPIQLSLGKRARVCEEELVLLMMMYTPSTSGVTAQPKTSENTTSMTSSYSSTTEKSSKRKKDSESVNVQEKHIFKRPKPPSMNSCGNNGYGISGSSESKDTENTSIQKQFRHFLENSTYKKWFTELSYLGELKMETSNMYYGYFTSCDNSVN